jgi:hypothetical protein
VRTFGNDAKTGAMNLENTGKGVGMTLEAVVRIGVEMYRSIEREEWKTVARDKDIKVEDLEALEDLEEVDDRVIFSYF